MKVEVLLFAHLREEVGPSVTIEVGEPADVASLRRALANAHPALEKIGKRAGVAVNEAWARDGDPVRPGDTVALLPPIAGG